MFASRSGELLKQIEPASGARTDLGRAPAQGRSDAAREAGMSPHQAKQATRVANVPADQFEAAAKLLVRNGFQGLKHRGTSGW